MLDDEVVGVDLSDNGDFSGLESGTIGITVGVSGMRSRL